jgi:hypothetical protein
MTKTHSKLGSQPSEKLFGSFEFWFFEIVSNFDIRYSDLLLVITVDYLQ